ncbi:MAG: arylsulfatase [Okeania sp. SIO2G4]|nr:arylsulfatase [Okeania sp. SIO4D6]NEP73020.1 arylsulfatase [Okeania sp. SIO2G5]NEP93784.1 arylsulfatase [Okeania sp. SIO2F5]NEQ91659.1 arylsulfatase [Okeania sp. SIO2G4]
MTLPPFVPNALALGTLPPFVPNPLPKTEAPKPNIIVILADDLGYADLGYQGSKILTPNIDKLAKTGVQLESYYGLPLCTQARAALLTGRHPMRYGLQTNVIFPGHDYGLPLDEVTLAEALKEVGYETAMVGKWHLGHAERYYWPNNRGFDHFYGNVVGEVDYNTKERAGVVDWQRNGEKLDIVAPEDGYYTDLIGEEAVKLIHQHDQSKPFFLYFSSLAPHTPLQAPPEDVAEYEADDLFPGDENLDQRKYAAMITILDEQVGYMLDALEEEGMRENTLIYFSTDNGGIKQTKFSAPGGGDHAEEPPASNAPFRGGKMTLYEGGVRVPAIVNWPAAQFQKKKVNEPLHHVDIMPTLLALAGVEGSPGHPFDGKNAWATIAEGALSPHEDILINVEAYRGAIRKGNWKLIKYATLPGKTELFDLSQDKKEQNNVAWQHPDIVEYLEARLVAYAKEQKFSEWLKTQPYFLDFEAQGQTNFDDDYWEVEDDTPLDQIPVLPWPDKPTPLPAQPIENVAQEDFWDTIIQQIDKRYSTK